MHPQGFNQFPPTGGKECSHRRLAAGKKKILNVFDAGPCFVNVNTAAQTADPTVPGRSPCHPPGIRHRSCHTRCPPAPSGPFGTSPDMNCGRGLAPALSAESPLLREGLKGIRGWKDEE